MKQFGIIFKTEIMGVGYDVSSHVTGMNRKNSILFEITEKKTI